MMIHHRSPKNGGGGGRSYRKQYHEQLTTTMTTTTKNNNNNNNNRTMMTNDHTAEEKSHCSGCNRNKQALPAMLLLITTILALIIIIVTTMMSQAHHHHHHHLHGDNGDDYPTKMARVALSIPGPPKDINLKSSSGLPVVQSQRPRPFEGLPRNLNKKTVYVHHRKGYATLRLIFKAMGWTLVDNNPKEAHMVYYAQSNFMDNPTKSLRPYQRYSRLPSSHEFRDKQELYEGLHLWAEAQADTAASVPEQEKGNPLWFLPETYRLSDTKKPSSQHSILYNNMRKSVGGGAGSTGTSSSTSGQEDLLLPNQQDLFDKRLYQQGGWEESWVLKCAGLDNGKGITFLPAKSYALKHWKQIMTNKTRECQNNNNKHVKRSQCTSFLVQSYIRNPLTWFHGEKFDLRFYWFIASIDPWIGFVHDGFARVSALRNYNATDFTSNKNHLPLANQSSSQNVTHEFVWQRVREFVAAQPKLRQAFPAMAGGDPVVHIKNQIKEIMGSIVQAIRYRLSLSSTNNSDNNNNGYYTATTTTTDNSFAVFGVDLMIDQNLDIYLIEVQHSPNIGRKDQFRVKMWNEIYSPILDIVKEIQHQQELDPQVDLYPLLVNGNGNGGGGGSDDDDDQRHQQQQSQHWQQHHHDPATQIQSNRKSNTTTSKLWLGGWELFYAGDWRFIYHGYKRRQNKAEPLR